MHVHWMFAPTNVRGNSFGPSCQLLSHTPPANRKAAVSIERSNSTMSHTSSFMGI